MNRVAWRVAALVLVAGLGCVAIAQAQRGFGPDERLTPDSGAIAAKNVAPATHYESTAAAPSAGGDPESVASAADRPNEAAPSDGIVQAQFVTQAPPDQGSPDQARRENALPPDFPDAELALEEPRALPAADEPAPINSDPFGSAQPLPIASGNQPGHMAPQSAGADGTGRPGNKQLEGPQSPALMVLKKAPPEVQVGKVVAIEVTVRNVGSVPANNVEVRDDVPTGARLHDTSPPANSETNGQLVWSLGTLAPGDEVRVVMQIVPQVEGELGSVATATFSAEATARSRVTRPRLEVAVTGPERIHTGDEAVFRVRITNVGTGTATGVLLEDALPESLRHPAGANLEYEVGQLAPNESHELELRITAGQAGAVSNRIMARGDGELLAETVADVEIIAPAIQVGLNGPKRRFLDRQATYVVSVSNPGTAPAKEVSLTTYLPEGLQFVAANNQGQYDSRTRAVHWLLEELPQGESGSVEVTTMPVEAGNHMLVVEGTAQRGISDKLEQPVLVEGVAAILFEVVDVEDPVEAGGQTTYEIRVTNQGSKAATNVQLAALLPQEMKALDAEGPVRYQMEERRVMFEPLPRLAPKADATYRVRVQALTAGDSRVRVQVKTDEMQTEVTKEESTQIYSDE